MTRVVHFEIHASNPKQIAEFYKKVFGWEIKQWGEQEYWLVTTGPEGTPGINGGIMKRKGDVPKEGSAVNTFVNTIDVVSVDTTVQIVSENGGTVVVQKTAVPSVGWLAYCKDPDGNIFGVMQRDAGAA